MRRFLVRLSKSEASNHTPSLADFTITTLELKFSVHTGVQFEITRDDIKRFAAEFDPQPFHLDEAAAEKTIFKGLAASGWHTAAISMRLCVEARPFGSQPLMG